MCLIIVKPKGKKLNVTLENHIWNGFLNNPDGFGYMWNDGRNVHIRKGFMTYHAANKALNKIGDWLQYCDVVFHSRWATHGTISKGNTHPFPLTKYESELTATEITTHMGIAHNGTVIECGGDKTTELSDTMIFIRDFLSDIPADVLLNDGVAGLIQMATSSKFALMTPDGVKLIGTFIKEKNGCYYSNKDYQEYSTKYSNLSWWGGNSKYGRLYNQDRNHKNQSLYDESWMYDADLGGYTQRTCNKCESIVYTGAMWFGEFILCKTCAATVKECYECGDIKDISDMSHLPNTCVDCWAVITTEEGDVHETTSLQVIEGVIK